MADNRLTTDIHNQQEIATQTKLFGGSIHSALVHAVTQYDIRQSRTKHYNRYALAQYLARVDDVAKDIANGATPRAAILAAFSDRLCDAALKAIGEPKFTREETSSAAWTYQSA